MSSFTTFYSFATALAAGVACALWVVPLAQFGRRFFVLMTLVAVIFEALALASAGLGVGYLHVAAASLLILHNVLIPSQRGIDVSARREAAEGGGHVGLAAIAQGVLVLAGVAGLAGVVHDAWTYPTVLPGVGGSRPWLVASFLASALLLGGAATSMVLGHWYLVSRKLSFRPLEVLSAWVLVALALRIGAAAGAAWLQREHWRHLIDASGMTSFLTGTGVFVFARVAFGMLGPAVLGVLAWRCVRIQANQSATGILYVLLGFVLIGEILAKYFLVSEQLLL